MHTSYPTPLYSPLAISYRNHQKSLPYFSPLAPLILFFLLKGRIKRRGGRHGPIGHLVPITFTGASNNVFWLLTMLLSSYCNCLDFRGNLTADQLDPIHMQQDYTIITAQMAERYRASVS